MTALELWTDGSAGPTNPGPGGWAVTDEHLPVLLGNEELTTNVRMEGRALIEAMRFADGRPAVIYTDSQLWVNIITKWGQGWRANGWRKGDGTEPANLGMVQEALEAYQGSQCALAWVKGHADNRGNQTADLWAGKARKMGAEPWCSCKGGQHKSGYRANHLGKYVASCCLRPAKMVWEDLYAGRAAAAPDSHARDTRARVQEPAGAGTPGEDDHQEGTTVEETIAQPSPAEEATGAGPIKFSNSELRAFKRCRRKWWLAYYRRLTLRKEGVGPLSIGNMIHHPLELYYASEDRDPETFDWETPLARHVEARLESPDLPEHLHGQMLEDYELVKIMLRGYFEWLTEEGADSEIRVIAAEREIEAYLGVIEGRDVWLIGKLDTETELRSDGRRVFMDHKSVQTMSDLPKTGPLDEQLKTYGLLQRLEAVAQGNLEQTFASGGMWNMLRKVKRSARSKPPYYGRASVSHNDEVYRNFMRRVWGEVRDILTVRRNLDAGGDHQVEAYPNPTRDCTWDCPFFMVCGQFDDGSDVETVIATEYVVHDPYERYTEVEKG